MQGSLPPRYALRRRLSRGAFSSVFEVFDRVLERPVALKILAEDSIWDKAAHVRLRREAAAAAAAGGCRFVVSIHDAGEWDGRPYFTMELLHQSLAERFATSRPSREDAFRWLEQAALAVDHVHSFGLVHRDVKPANLLLDAEGDLRLVDFGVAIRSGDTRVTESGHAVGTPPYMAPEQEQGRPGTASDRYALAVVAQELLTGTLPPDVPSEPRLADALDQALAESPSARSTTAAALVAALGAATEALPTTLARPIVIPRTTAVPQHGPSVAPIHRTERPWRRRLALAVGALVVAVLAATAAHLATLADLTPRVGAARPLPPPSVCTASAADHDANVVVSGVRAHAFCGRLVDALATQDVAWGYRNGRALLAPDHGDPGGLSLVCRLERRRLRVAVYDDGKQEIGRSLCNEHFTGGWAESSLT